MSEPEYGKFGAGTCDACGKSEQYCPECSSCHACIEEMSDAQSAQITALKKRNDALVEVAKAMRDWIDSVPRDIELPVMPGFDRDWADNVINGNIEDDD